MATTPYDIIAGPADVWIGAVGATFQAVNASDATRVSASWLNLGFTEGGVMVKHTQTVDLLNVDQRTGAVKAIRSAEGLEITFNMSELTFANMAYLLTDASAFGVVATGSPNKNTMKPYQGLDVKQWALMVRGPSPYMSAYLQYNVPIVVQTDEPELAFVRDNKAVMAVKFVALEDPAASTAADRFGSMVAQTS